MATRFARLARLRPFVRGFRDQPGEDGASSEGSHVARRRIEEAEGPQRRDVHAEAEIHMTTGVDEVKASAVVATLRTGLKWRKRHLLPRISAEAGCLSWL